MLARFAPSGLALLIVAALPQLSSAAPCETDPLASPGELRIGPSFPNPDQAVIASYQAWDEGARRKLQQALIWSGGYTGEVDGIIGPATIRAIRTFQVAAGVAPSGVLLSTQAETLYRDAEARERSAGFRRMWDKSTGFFVGIPTQHASYQGEARHGSAYASPDGVLQIRTLRIRDGRTLCQLYLQLRMRPQRQLVQAIHRDNSFVLRQTEGHQALFINAHERAASDGTGSELVALSISYPVDRAAEYQHLLVAMWNAFKPFEQVVAQPQPWNDKPRPGRHPKDRDKPTGTVAGERDPSVPPQPTKPAIAERRVALVIGNGRYANASALPNPANDARAVARMLRDIGFDVSEGTDLDRTGMERLVRDFLEKASDARVALLYYAGHGMQVDGRNYLVPIDAKLATASALAFETVEVDKILDGLNDLSRANIVILDACRDNPLVRSFSRQRGATRSSSVASGLAPYSTVGTGTLIAFATAPGQVALDGERPNSPFTAALIRHMNRPGVEVQQMLTHVRSDVAKATGNKQVPWTNSSLLGEVYLAGR